MMNENPFLNRNKRYIGAAILLVCFIVMLVMVLMSLERGPQNIQFTGTTIINAFLGSIVVGWGFSLTGLIYEREDIAFPLQFYF